MNQKYDRKLTENIDQIDSNYVSKVLSNNVKGVKKRIDVPLYQRSYTWKREKVSVLFEDLINHHKEKSNKAYYLGQLVFIKNTSTDTIEVLDGQQRLTTLYIFINALINCMEKLKREIKADSGFSKEVVKSWNDSIEEEIDLLYEHIIAGYNETEFIDGEERPKETENKFLPYYEDDREHFNFLFKRGSIIDFDAVRDKKKIRKMHKIIVAGFTLYENINAHCSSAVKDRGNNDLLFREKFHELKCIKNILLGDFIEVSYTVLEPGIEFTIFETLNDRGEDLNGYDLTRNLMLNIAGKSHINKRPETLSVFDKTIKTNCSPKRNFSETEAVKLMLAIWNMSNEGKVSAGKYMKKFIEFVRHVEPEGNFERKKPNAVERFSSYLKKLEDCSYAYSELLSPEKIKNLDFGTKTEKKILWQKVYLFKKTNTKQHIPIYLALRFKNADLSTIIKYQKLIEKIYVNFILLSKKSPSLIESEMSSIAHDIYTTETKELDNLHNTHLDDIKNFAKENKVNFESFIDDFTLLKANNSVSTYLLLNIVLAQPGLDIDITSTLTLEHVMPERADFEKEGDNWFDPGFLKKNGQDKNLSEEIFDDYLDRIGNHTILLNADNIDLSNKSYDYKLNTYKKDGSSKITNGTTDLSVSKFNKWNADAIEKRQKALAVEAKKIWGF